uniref:Uncharacterized protein n=2 Tax=Plectus sambesii TaxID=2011161 RepID=A0A914W5H0_9BILA
MALRHRGQQQCSSAAAAPLSSGTPRTCAIDSAHHRRRHRAIHNMTTALCASSSAMLVSVGRGYVEVSDYLPYIDDSSSERGDDCNFVLLEKRRLLDAEGDCFDGALGAIMRRPWLSWVCLRDGQIGANETRRPWLHGGALGSRYLPDDHEVDTHERPTCHTKRRLR